MPAAAQFSILTVCTGNICRSPAVERLLRAGLPASVQVTSAGTGAVVGHPIDDQMARLLRAAGVPDAGFAARQLRPDQVRSADLVLALTTTHRAAVLREVPAALRRSFTLLEFARIIEAPQFPPIPAGGVPERLRFMVAEASRHRMLGEVVSSDDVPDPYRLDDAVFESTFTLIQRAVDAIVRAALG
ncbi:MAG: hypothetical protein WBL05_02105 [Brooklawnia sp.]|uniref:arsenate reductase/protein-tyrosine-phosphatase family protein n=1 Tax=Brooklawnia sp. TaxID=2699740 RepID=UPI003C7409E7